MDDRIRHVGKQASQFVYDTLSESARQVVNERADLAHRQGFTRAAAITLRHVDEKIDALKEQMKGSADLTKAELAIYAQLDELKSEIEADWIRYWRSGGVDWRPPKAVKGVVMRQTGESSS